MKKNIKFHLTVLGFYFIIVILYSMYSYKCDLLFGICGIQYLVYGFVFPALYFLLSLWNTELRKKLKLSQNTFKYIALGVLYGMFAIYVILVPTKLFRPFDLYTPCIQKMNSAAQQMSKNGSYPSNAIIDFYCKEQAAAVSKLLPYDNMISKRSLKKAYKTYHKLYENAYNIKTMSCERTLNLETHICNYNHNVKFYDKTSFEAELCKCQGNMMTIAIHKTKKDTPEDLLLSQITSLRADTEKACTDMIHEGHKKMYKTKYVPLFPTNVCFGQGVK